MRTLITYGRSLSLLDRLARWRSTDSGLCDQCALKPSRYGVVRREGWRIGSVDLWHPRREHVRVCSSECFADYVGEVNDDD